MSNLKTIFKNIFLTIAYVSLFSISANAATITVDSAADNLTASDASCTLREAITNANNDADSTGGDCTAGAGTDTIEFAIGAGLQTITALSELPEITAPLNIDATTQPGTQSCTDKDLLIELQADFGLIDISGLSFGAAATGSSVRGMSITGFINDLNNNSAGINTEAQIDITCNLLGLDASGSASPNSYGVYITGNNVTVGGPTLADGNIISGNSLIGVNLLVGTGLEVLNNYIGTNIDGSADLGNGTYGITTTLGGTSTIGPGNIISGNNSGGINLDSDTHTVIGNYIGINADGDAAIPNGRGIFTDSSFLTIGGDTPAERNIISGNAFGGIDARGSFESGITIQGNYIGTNADGDAAIPNLSHGVRAESGVTLGGPNLGEGNVISGNGGLFDFGVFLEGDANIVQGNYIGTNADGDDIIPNGDAGLNLTGNTNTVGGDTAAERNVISGNGGNGIRALFSGTNTIQGNYIGVSANGLADLGNGGIGIESFGAGNIVGGPNSGEGNVISGNTGAAITMGIATIQGNIIGLNSTGNIAISNDGGGVISSGTIGGDTVAERNVISGNTGVGLQVLGNTTIQGNYIGTSSDGLNAVPNTTNGIQATGDNIQIGGINPGEGNIISGNGEAGIFLSGEQISIEGNLIGVAIDESAIGNGTFGVSILQQEEDVFIPGDGFVTVFSPSDLITIGGLTMAHSNVISANQVAGIFVNESNTNISILGNYIGTDSTGTIVPRGLATDPLGNGEGGSAGEDAGGIIAKSSSSVLIGNFLGTGANTIGGNFGPGITVSQNTALAEADVTILSNSIFENSDIGIDLANDTSGDGFSDSELGATANDASDADTGANGLLNFIELTAKTDNGADFTIDYTLDIPAGDYLVQFFENTTADATNFGEGENLADSIAITHGGTGEESFSSTIVLADATNLSATITEDLGGGVYGATSEFSSTQIQVIPPAGGGGGSGGGSNGSASSGADTSSPFSPSSTTPVVIIDEEVCNSETALKDIEQFQGFEREVSRFEALEYILLINCIGLDELPENPADYPFSDINLEDERIARVLYTGFNRSIVKGYPDGTFKPTNTVNYVELLAMNARAKNLAEDTDESGEQWFSSYINLSLTIQLALNNVGFGDSIEGDIFYLITKTFIDS